LAAPKRASFTRSYLSAPQDRCPTGTVDDLEISFPTSPGTDYDDGRVSVCVCSATDEKETYRAGKKINWIHGLKYTECVNESDVRELACGVYTFQNGLSYQFSFSFYIGQPGMVEWGCLDPPISESREQSFVRLFLSHVSFLKLEVHPRQATQAPQIVRFEDPSLVRHHAYSSSLIEKAVASKETLRKSGWESKNLGILHFADAVQNDNLSSAGVP
jgi:hypothetical protein